MATAEIDVDEVEASVFSEQRTRDSARIYRLKRELAEMRWRGGAVARPAPQVRRGPGARRRPGLGTVLPRRRRPPGSASGSPSSQFRRAAVLRVRRAPGRGISVHSERGHAQDLGVGGDHRRPDLVVIYG
ncbi:MAG: hypothetical protein R2734_00890 [Nocardioides sp.]